MTLTSVITNANEVASRTPCDCVQDCKTVIKAAQKTIADRDQLISDQTKTITDLGIQMDAITKDRDSDRDALTKWYHNPFALVGLGIVVGGMGTLFLERK